MNKYKALESIKLAWGDNSMPLGQKVVSISSEFYSTGLDLATTAAHIRATPSELDALLAMGELDDEVIELLSEANPPKTAWTFLSSASDEEAELALKSLIEERLSSDHTRIAKGSGEFVYYMMMDVAGPTTEQRVGNLPGDVIKHALKKGEDFDALTDWQKKFLNSIAAQKKRGKTLSEKQIAQLMKALNELADKGAIVRDSIDGDSVICDEILDALGR